MIILRYFETETEAYRPSAGIPRSGRAFTVAYDGPTQFVTMGGGAYLLVGSYTALDGRTIWSVEFETFEPPDAQIWRVWQTDICPTPEQIETMIINRAQERSTL